MKFDFQSPLKSFNWKKFFKIVSAVLAGYVLCFLILLLALRWVNPPFTAFTLQEDWSVLGAERYDLRTNWVPGDELPDHLKLAAISSEDQRFREHWGVDLKAIEKAANQNEEGKRRGASTITQQVAKNLFLTPARTYFRKGVEAGISVFMEVFWPKERILEVYLNIAEFGPGIFGVGKASSDIYGKQAFNLTPMESARLAAVLPRPKSLRVEPASPFVQERSLWILRQMTYLSGNSYIPKPDPIPKDTTYTAAVSNTEASSETDSMFIQNQPQIGRAEIPDSLMQVQDIDPLLDSVWVDSVEVW